ncbi:hypothetical protein L198_03915 [Cryptococcus wingfieldii CBS 7118]|uniref:BTB domain-containing protein n=1 Tax=Cryptococcus wingfieldii CBS 7118 TaxID=1295528 RepID=A0A1E3J934_9TREE|nr:hypothetical protein L198_03915 [Cryptococcus wingfieldii CBS 7118]ODN97352.1 hypothetical protein L198_03915 [Cryptococcus wingfieldii CBS 7118]
MASDTVHHNGNGAAVLNGDPETAIVPSNEIDPIFHAVSLARGIFNVGYINQEWSDVHLVFFASGLKAHRLILARSPYLAHLMAASAPGSTIKLSFADANITQEAVHISLQHLYNPSLSLVQPGNARAVLATAFLFGGMPELVHQAYLITRDSIDASNAVDLVRWLEVSPELAMFAQQQPPKAANGVQSTEGGISAWLDNPYPRYGEWTIRLKHDVLNYLLNDLPSRVVQEDKLATPDNALVTTYSLLPYELFKSLVESSDLPITSPQDRFSFAKRVLAQRKKSAVSGTPQMEENVVLAFRGGDGMEVHVTRRPKKGRTFYKVEG